MNIPHDNIEEIFKEEKEILKEVRKEENAIRRLSNDIRILIILVLLIIAGIVAGVTYWNITAGRVYIENASISAPHIALTSSKSGVLKRVFVSEGDSVYVNTQVAQVGDEILRSKIAGFVIKIKDTPGEIVNSGEAVVTMIDPAKLRVVGNIEEDKGLKDISVGQRAVFTVDAFGGEEFEGIVESITPTSNEGDVVFNISDKRQEKEFSVKVRYSGDHPEFLDGMSAKLWIYKK